MTACEDECREGRGRERGDDGEAALVLVDLSCQRCQTLVGAIMRDTGDGATGTPGLCARLVAVGRFFEKAIDYAGHFADGVWLALVLGDALRAVLSVTEPFLLD